MSGLRALALSYLASAAVFCLAATYAAHPDLDGLVVGAAGRLWQSALDTARRHDLPALGRLDIRRALRLDGAGPAVTLAMAPPGPRDERTLVRARTLAIAPRSLDPAEDRFTDPTYSASASVTILPDLSPRIAPQPTPANPKLAHPRMPRARAPQFDVAQSAPPIVLPEPPPLNDAAPQTRASARAIAVAARLKENLTPEMLQHFDLFLYVSKSERGPLAQRLYVFRKTPDRKLALLYDWAASTGREKREVSPRGRSSFTGTPRGYYELDPGRMYRKYRSYSWDQPMPYAMFFNWERQGLQTGLAIHAASGDDIALLGQRASAGCVHLSPENARTLYELIRSEYRGQVPRFAYDSRSQTMSNDGTLMRDAKGGLRMADGYKVLVQIEDYSGDDSIAALF
jgi:lipoprotein-anchoring transpeptidase ErfK/SrfK